MKDEASPPVGIAERLEPNLRRILAPNPSHMTLWGTNTYIVGTGEVAVIDPGPDMPEHLDAILASGERITSILVSHTHMDHLGLAARLKEATGAPICGFSTAAHTFDRHLADGDVIQGAGWQLGVIHTPGHIDDHICFGLDDVCLTGDHVMGWSSSVIIPPRGDVGEYIASLEKLALHPWRRLHSAHGLPMDDPAERLAYLIRHRLAREESVVKTLSRQALSLEDLVARLYATTPRALHGAATRNIEAHLIRLIRDGRIAFDEPTRTYRTA